MKILYVLLIFLSLSTVSFAFAQEPVLITLSDDMDKLTLDGKWTHMTEWKKSSLNEYHYGNHTVILRSAHQDNFVYILLDFITDINPEKGKDFATICFDTVKNNTSTENNYCFSTILDGKMEVKKGELHNGIIDYKTIPKPKGVVAISTASDEGDRYTRIPHSSYEFKIPTELISRNNVYDFYFGVYDFKSNSTYTYPPEIIINSTNQIPDPAMWGKIISPDKSLPEFHFPFIAMLSSIALVIYFVKRFNSKNE